MSWADLARAAVAATASCSFLTSAPCNSLAKRPATAPAMPMRASASFSFLLNMRPVARRGKLHRCALFPVELTNSSPLPPQEDKEDEDADDDDDSEPEDEDDVSRCSSCEDVDEDDDEEEAEEDRCIECRTKSGGKGPSHSTPENPTHSEEDEGASCWPSDGGVPGGESSSGSSPWRGRRRCGCRSDGSL